MTRNFSCNASGKPIYFLYDPNGKQSNFHVMQVVGQLNFFFFFFLYNPSGKHGSCYRNPSGK